MSVERPPFCHYRWTAEQVGRNFHFSAVKLQLVGKGHPGFAQVAPGGPLPNESETPELAARVQGARDAIQQIIENSTRGDTTARNTLLTRANREKLEMLFGKTRADRLIGDLEAEVLGKGKVENVIGGSQTTPKKERVNAMLPTPSEMGYLSHLDLTKPASFIPEWMKPQTILEGARSQRYSDAYRQVAPLLTRRTEAPDFQLLVNDLLGEQSKKAVQTNRLMQMGRAATVATNAVLPAVRRKLPQQHGDAR